MKKRFLIISLFMLLTVACTNTATTTEQAETKMFPEFNADSCLLYLKAQTDLGARVPNTDAHDRCRDYIVYKFEQCGLKVIKQDAELKAHDGKILHSTNIIASFNPDVRNRIFIASHYDSRPWCDEESLKEDAANPVLGANDGASGVAVMIELARIISQNPIETIGVDLICFDSEDYGISGAENSFCLGSQYWAKNLHRRDYKPRFGILLDMVGDPNAAFYREQVSEYYASDIVDLVWKEAGKAGYSDVFKNQQGGAITDDHYYVNALAGIPCIDIIDYKPGIGFPETWHTAHDTPDHISAKTLGIVGNVLVRLIYK